ncbi:MAG TPA: glutamine amidotransferase [Bryobacteraceae bacterium]|nr:glutamine amidotransferase [Bryobacteraceae bacterium]
MFEFIFQHPLSVFQKGTFVLQSGWPVWLLGLLVAAGAGLMGLFVWRKTLAAGWPMLRGAVLWFLQSTMVAVLLLLLWQPGISVATLKKQQNVVAVLLDDSKSMGLADGGAVRREAMVKTLDSGLLAELKKRFQVRFYKVSDHLERTEDYKTLHGDRTASRLADGLKQIAAETGSLPIGGVVLMTDGADTTGGIDRETVNALKGRQVPVHTVGYGRESYDRDVALVDVQTPSRALADSRLGVQVTLRQKGYAGQRAKLVVKDGDKPLASRDVTLAADGTAQTETVLFNAGPAGVRTVQVQIQPLSNEENAGNNAMTRLVQVEDRKPRVLYIEGEPRWEFKFIRRALDEDKAVQLVTMLRTTQNKIYRQGVKDPKELETGFPATAEEMFAYDGIIVGTVEASYFTPAQQALLKAFVDRRGGGVLFLGGRASLADGGYGASDFRDILPVEVGDRRTTFLRDKANVELTANGRDNLTLRIEEDPARNVDRWKKLPYLADFQSVGTVKPGAVVLVDAITQRGRSPLLVTQNYGRGRSAVLATGGTWRWQMLQPVEDKSHEMFWQQLLRWLVAGSPGTVQATTSQSVFTDDPKIPLRAEVRGKQYELLPDGQVEARISGPAGAGATVQLQPDPVHPGVYTGEYSADQPGSYLVEMIASHNGERTGVDTLAFRREDGVAEGFYTEQNRELLERLAAETGGKYWKPDQTEKLPEEIALSEGGISSREIRDLWHLPVVFLLLAALRAGEWLLRRRWGAV